MISSDTSSESSSFSASPSNAGSNDERGSGNLLVPPKFKNRNFTRFPENKNIRFGFIYQLRWRQILIVGLSIGVILILTLLGCLVYRSSRNDSTKKSNSPGDENLVPPDPEFPQPASWSILKKFKRGAVSADGVPCAEIGKSMLDRNGSAVDAAIASMICNGLINMQSMGFGGGFLMTVYERSTGQAFFLNAREAAPIRSSFDMYRNKSATASRIGPLAIGVPGEIAGYWEAHQRFGKLPWSELFRPSIELCKAGYNLTKAQWDALSIHPPNIYEDPTLRKMFVADETKGEFVRPGSIVKPDKLCETMRIIAEKNASVLYNGSLGRSLVNDLKNRGSILTMKDLNIYRALWSNPIRIGLSGGLQLITSGLPSSGPLLAFVLNIIDNYRFNSTSLANLNSTIVTYHRLVEIWKYAYAMRTELGDENFVNQTEIMEKLTSTKYARLVRDKIKDDRTFDDPRHYGATGYSTENHGTAHISVLAPNGDAVSVTSSVNIYFGSGVVSESTGILMNSAMDDFDSISGVNYFGLPPGKHNYIEPGKRSFSSKVPSIIVQDDGEVRMVIGGAGGTKITTAVSYVIARHLWMNNSIKEAIDAARIHHQLFPMTISYEFGVTRPIIQGLKNLGHPVSRYRDRGSVVSALVKINGTIYANADYRKNGDVCGID